MGSGDRKRHRSETTAFVGCCNIESQPYLNQEEGRGTCWSTQRREVEGHEAPVLRLSRV